jgi:2-polyprenyl-3-methyl-5-hydroxy-6-metoxy-1,4-benzoquinol methylase
MNSGTENEGSISRNLRKVQGMAGGIASLARRFLGSEEVEEKNMPSLAPPEITVDMEASAEELASCIATIREHWTDLGKKRPHHSVLTNKLFLPENIQGNLYAFWESGHGDVATIRDILQRHNFGLLEEKTCVEYGCGVGRNTLPLAKLFRRVHAYDISSEHISLARQYAEESNITNIDFHLCTDSLISPLNECDFFYSIIVFQHNPPPVIVQLIRNSLNALKIHGIAMFQVPTYIPSYEFRIKQWLKTKHPMDMQMHCLPQEKVFDVIHEENCIPLLVREDDKPGIPESISNTFVVKKLP